MNRASPWYRQPVRDIDLAARARGEARQAILTKPPGSLGRLETLAVRACVWMGDEPSLDHPAVVVFTADHGIAAEGVSAFPQAVTGEMLRNFVRGQRLDMEGVSFRVTVSLGCATRCGREIRSAEQLLACADHALHRAREQGGDRVVALLPGDAV